MRYILNLVSGKYGKLKESESLLLYSMLQDRERILGSTSRNPTLDTVLKAQAEQPKMPLYRGLLPKELEVIEASKSDPDGVALNTYQVFTELRSYAEWVAATAKTKALLEILPSNQRRGRALCFHRLLSNQIKSGALDKVVSEANGSKARSLKLLAEEKEWFYGMDLIFRASKTYKKGNFTVIQVQPV